MRNQGVPEPVVSSLGRNMGKQILLEVIKFDTTGIPISPADSTSVGRDFAVRVKQPSCLNLIQVKIKDREKQAKTSSQVESKISHTLARSGQPRRDIR